MNIGKFSIAKSAKLPLDFCRGNVLQREKNVLNMSKKLYKIGKSSEFRKETNLNIFLDKTIKRILPSKIKFKIYGITEEQADGSKAVCVFKMAKGDKLKSYELLFADCSNENVAHETYHLFNGINNPKMLIRQLKHQYNTPAINYYFNEIYNVFEEKSLKSFKKLFKDNLTEMLCSGKNEKIIDLLQFYRYSVKDEIGALNTGIKYAKKSSTNIIEYVKHCLTGRFYKKLRLPQKLEIIEEILGETLKKEREIHRMKMTGQ